MAFPRFARFGDVRIRGSRIGICWRERDDTGSAYWLTTEGGKEELIERIELARQRRELHKDTCDALFLTIQGFAPLFQG